MLGLSSSLVKGGTMGRQYIKDGLKLYMPYKGADVNKGVQFVGTGSTSFDGGTDYVSFGDVCDLGADDFTIICWAKADDWTESYILTKWVDPNNRWYFGGDSSDNIAFYSKATSVGVAVTGGSMTSYEGEWVHVAIVADRSASTTFYVNGVVSGSVGAGSTVDIDNSGNLNMSDDPAHAYGFDGSLKNCTIWSRALTATEVQNVMYKTYPEVSGRLASGLVSWWGLDVDYTDYHGDNDGTNSGSTLNTDLYGGDTPVIPRAIDNAPTVQADAIGAGSASFDGSSYIHIGDIGATANAICMWFKPDTAVTNSTGYAFLMNLNNASSYHGIALGPFTSAFDNEIITIVDDDTHMSSYESASASISTDWHHLALSYNGTSPSGYWDIYLDGVSLPITEYSTSEAIDVDYLQFGRRSDGGGHFNGNICQVGIWSAALTQAQIQSIMEKTYEELIASEKTNLVSYWALDEADGNGVVDKVDETSGSELVTNGTFDSGISGWSDISSGDGSVAWNSDGYMEVTGISLSHRGKANTSFTTVSGSTYKFVATKTNDTNMDVKIGNASGGGQITGEAMNPTGTNTYYFTAISSTTHISFWEAGNGTAQIDNVSVKLVNGNAGILI